MDKTIYYKLNYPSDLLELPNPEPVIAASI